jgi:inhibitor of cysteine peptidase
VKKFADPGETIHIEAGESFAIELAGNPTTGYMWQPDVDSQHLELLGQKFEPGRDGVGAGGKEIFRFRALAAGVTEIAFAYRRPWDKESRDTNSFQVAISG